MLAELGAHCQLRFRSIVEKKRGRMLKVAWMLGRADQTWLELEQAGDHELFWGPLHISSGSLKIWESKLHYISWLYFIVKSKNPQQYLEHCQSACWPKQACKYIDICDKGQYSFHSESSSEQGESNACSPVVRFCVLATRKGKGANVVCLFLLGVATLLSCIPFLSDP